MTRRPRARLMLWCVVAACALAAPAARALGAQSANRARRGWTPLRVAKWTLLGVTVGAGYYALRQSTRADRAYSDLRHLCSANPASCTLEGARYPDAGAEALYAASLRHDRKAQAGILGGQATLLASAALFVYDLRNGRGPENIPYPGLPPRASLRRAEDRGAGAPRRAAGVLATDGTLARPGPGARDGGGPR